MKKIKVDSQLFEKKIKKIISLTTSIVFYKKQFPNIWKEQTRSNRLYLFENNFSKNKRLKNLSLSIFTDKKYCSVNTYIQEELNQYSFSEHHIGVIYYIIPLVESAYPLILIGDKIYQVLSKGLSRSDVFYTYSNNSKIMNFINSFDYNGGTSLLENRGLHLLMLKEFNINYLIETYYTLYKHLVHYEKIKIDSFDCFVDIVFKNTITKLLLDFNNIKEKQINYFTKQRNDYFLYLENSNSNNHNLRSSRRFSLNLDCDSDEDSDEESIDGVEYDGG